MPAKVIRAPCALSDLEAIVTDIAADNPPAAVRVGESILAIGDRLALPSATLSFHLNQLRHAGLVTFRREGRSLIYAAEYAAMNDLLAYLTENCCQGDASACSVSVCDGSTLVSTRKESVQ